MEDVHRAIDQHYGIGGLMGSILEGLKSQGINLNEIKPGDLVPVDEFHTRGKESTLELAARAQFRTGQKVLDVGCGLGGSVRHIAAAHGCTVTGLDLTQEYIDVAKQLAELVGLSANVSFEQGSALELPFESESFDVVWTEHTQMNIDDKRNFYGEIRRVLAPGGRMVFHDIFQGVGGAPYYPTPWAQDSSISSLVTQTEARAVIEKSGFTIVDWVEKSEQSLEWFRAALEKTREAGPPPLGLHLLMGPTARTKFTNVMRNLEEARITIVQGVADRQ